MRAPEKNERKRSLPDLPEDVGDLAVAELVDGEPLDDARVPDGDYSGKALRLVARQSVFERCSFAGARMCSARLRDVRFVQCDLSNADVRGLQASRVEFVDCRLTGMKAIECRLEDVLLERCEARYAQLNDGSARGTEFIEVQMQEADLRALNLEGARWIRSDLSRADLTGAKLEGADLRGAEIEGMLAGAADVYGAKVSPSQAIQLARLLGVVIG